MDRELVRRPDDEGRMLHEQLGGVGPERDYSAGWLSRAARGSARLRARGFAAIARAEEEHRDRSSQCYSFNTAHGQSLADASAPDRVVV